MSVVFQTTMVASIEDDDTTDSLPDKSFSKELYAKYELKNVLGRYVCSHGWIHIRIIFQFTFTFATDIRIQKVTLIRSWRLEF